MKQSYITYIASIKTLIFLIITGLLSYGIISNWEDIQLAGQITCSFIVIASVISYFVGTYLLWKHEN